MRFIVTIKSYVVILRKVIVIISLFFLYLTGIFKYVEKIPINYLFNLIFILYEVECLDFLWVTNNGCCLRVSELGVGDYLTYLTTYWMFLINFTGFFGYPILFGYFIKFRWNCCAILEDNLTFYSKGSFVVIMKIS